MGLLDKALIGKAMWWTIANLVEAGPLGELMIVLPIAGLLALWCWLSRERRGAVAIVGVTAFTLIAVVALKSATNSLGRPSWIDISPFFPSGHVAMATTVYGAAAVCFRRVNRWLGALAGALVAGILLGVALERMIRAGHPLMDVMGGFAVGIVALGILGLLWPSGRLRGVGAPAVAVAAAIIAAVFYGWSLPTSAWIEQAVASVRATIPVVLNHR